MFKIYLKFNFIFLLIMNNNDYLHSDSDDNENENDGTDSNQYNNDNNNNYESSNEHDYEVIIYTSQKQIFNQIPEIKAIKNPTMISSIQIRLSNLSNLKGLNAFKNITHADLSNNEIVSLRNNLSHLQKLKYLNLSCNKITALDGIEDLESLTELNVSHNKITSLEPFSRFFTKRKLVTLDIKGNLIMELKQFDYLVGFTALKTLILSENNDSNPVCQNANCNEYIEGVLSSVDNYQNQSKAKTTGKHYAQPNTTNPRMYQQTFDTFLRNNNMDLQPPFSSGIKPIKQLTQQRKHSPIQQQFRNGGSNNDGNLMQLQQELQSYKNRNNELESQVSRLNLENQNIRTKNENLELTIRDLKYKNADLYQDNTNTKQSYHEKELECNDLLLKLAQIKKDYELTLIEKSKLIQLNKDYSSEITSLKDSVRELKLSNDKIEMNYKDLLTKKNDEMNMRLREISNLETKIYDYGKSAGDKQKEIETLIETNNSLQQNIIRLNKSKNEFEFEMNKKIENELSTANEKYKTTIEELERKYTATLNNKTEECLNDIKALEKHYETLLSEANDKLTQKDKEISSLSLNLEECKNLLKISIDKEDKNIKQISDLSELYENIKAEHSKISQRNKNMELELKDINSLNNNQHDTIQNQNTLLDKKEKEIKSLHKEIESLESKISEKEDIISDLLTQIKEINSRPDLDELNEIIKTKTLLADDQANQIINLNQQIEDMKNANGKVQEKYMNYKKKLDNLGNELKQRDEHCSELEMAKAHYETELVAYESKLNEKEELIKLIQDEMGEIKNIISDDQAKIERQNKELQLQNEKIVELNQIILQQRDDNKEILTCYEKYKNEKEQEGSQLSKENSEMKNEIMFLVNEYEKLKVQNEKYQASFMQFNRMMNMNMNMNGMNNMYI